jgi:hypothetical protein
MRNQILGATAAILGASVLSIGLPTAPTHGAAWQPLDKIPFPAGNPSEVEIVSTGDGDAIAAAIINGAVHATTAIDGKWVGYDEVRGAVGATGLVLTANDDGEAAIGWEENVSGDQRLRVSRQVSPTSWTGLQLLTPVGTDVVGTAELGMAGNGRVIAAATVDEGDIDNKLITTEWAANGILTKPHVLSAADAWNASLDVNEKGEALVAWNYIGLIDDVLTVARRSAAGTWNTGNSTHNSGNIAASPDVALSDNGQGQVVYAVVKNGFYVAETSRILPTGAVQEAEYASPLDEHVYEPSVDINATGSALFTWVAKKNALTNVRYSTAADAAYPGASQILSNASVDTVDPTARISDSGLRVIQYGGGGYVTTHYRTGGVQPFVASPTGNGFSPVHAVDVDDEGNAIMAGFKPGGLVYGRFLDATGPTVNLPALPLNTIATNIKVDWTMQDSLSTIPGTDVYATAAAWNQAAHGAPSVVVDNAAGTQTSVPAEPGTSYCIQVRPTDAANNSTTTDKRCTTVPLDDRSLNGTGWNEANEAGNFRSTLTTTTVKGRTLSRANIKAKRLSLVVRKVSNGGTVRVTFAGDVLGSYSLKGTGKKKVINLETFPTVKTGTLTIKVTSDTGKAVKIDGLVVAK